MEATGLSLGKSVLDGALGYAKSAIAEEVALQLGIQSDHAFIRDELDMMMSFLMAAHDERDEHKVIKTWVKQVRDVAYDAEDCLQDFAVRLSWPSRWSFLQTLFDRHNIATQMKGLRTRVEDVSQRNVRYRLIKGTGDKPATSVALSRLSGATMFGIEEAKRQKDKAKVDLSKLIMEEVEDLRVIAVWGTRGMISQTTIIRGVYNDLKRRKIFKYYAWIRIMHPFNLHEFFYCIMRQFYFTYFEEAGNIQEETSVKAQTLKLMGILKQDRKAQEETSLGAQVLKTMGMMNQYNLVDAFNEHVRNKSYLIVLSDLSTIEEWDSIKDFFPNNKEGSRIIISTERGEIASLCVGEESVISELKQSYVDQNIFASYEKVSQNGSTLTKSDSTSRETTIDTNESVVPINVTMGKQNVAVNENIVRARHIGAIAGASEELQLVGREKEKTDIINLISNQDGEQVKVISIWGMGGVGKTTLVKEIYQSQELTGFEKRACITVMRPFVLEEALRSLVMQLDTKSSNKSFEELDKLLEGKRCLIVLDDLSSVEEWDEIRKQLGKMTNSSRIIVTTREEYIAKHCSEKKPENIYKLKVLEYKEALHLFTQKVFNEAIDLDNYPELLEQGEKILKKCDGLPLAIVTIGGFLARQPRTPMEWRKLNEHISTELEMNPELGMISTVLTKSYDGLPYHLKSCFLYMSIFPENYNIRRKRLVRRWTAEGYSSEVHSKSTEEVADSYFAELIDRSMILPLKESIGGIRGISYCKLHELMREISISKSMEENLVFKVERGCSLNTQGTIRHLAISSNWEGDRSEFESIVDLSRIRSLTVFGQWKPFYISDKMRVLRVLDLEGTKGLYDHHLQPIGKLLHLKYLSLRGCDEVYYLPDSLGNLKQLQTLDTSGTGIIKMPQAIIKLTKLENIRAGLNSWGSYEKVVESLPKLPQNKLCMWTAALISCIIEFTNRVKRVESKLSGRDVCDLMCCVMLPFIAGLADPGGVVLPKGLRKLKALHTLGVVNIARGKAILQDIKKLTRLRKLEVIGINKKNCHGFSSTLSNLSCLEALSLMSIGEPGLTGTLDDLRFPSKNLQSLKLQGTLDKLPEWMAELHNLVKLKLVKTKLTDVDRSMQVLGKLPNLSILCLLHKSFQGEGVCLTFYREASFPSLTVLELQYLPGISPVVFDEGTTPKLELLVIRGRISIYGLSSLRSLKEVMLNSNYYVKDMRSQLDKNPRKPVLKIID